MRRPNSSIRINLRFGARTDPLLLQELTRLSPDDRARWVRSWIVEGWRAHSRNAYSVMPPDHEAHPSHEVPDSTALTATAEPPTATSLEEDLMMLIERSAR